MKIEKKNVVNAFLFAIIVKNLQKHMNNVSMAMAWTPKNVDATK